MANNGFTGGETGDLAEFATSNGITLSSATKKTGLYSYEFDASADTASFNTATGTDKTFVGFYFRTDHVSDNRRMLAIRVGGSVQATVELDASDNLTVLAAGGTTQAGSTALLADTWYFIELRFEKGTGSDAIAEVRLNGSVEATSTDGTSTSTSSNVFLTSLNISSGTQWIDDIRTRDDAYPGDGFVAGLRPDAVGDEDDFTGTFADIDDDPIADGTLRTQDGGTPIPFLNNVGALTVSTVDQVRVKVRASRSGGPGRTHFIRWKKPGGTAEDSADVVLDTGVAFFSFTPSDQPTTQAHIDDMQGGMSQSAAGGRLAECTELWIMVDYTTAAPPAGGRIPDDRVRRMAPILAQ